MKSLLLLASFLISQSARPEYGRVQGQIRSTDGLPAADVHVAAMDLEQYGNVNPATAILSSLGRTDAQGRYRLENVPPGRYFITAGLENSPSYFPGARTPQEARVIAVTANQLVSGIDFTLATSIGVRVRGQVINLPDPFPSDLWIRLQPLNELASTNRLVPRDGRFEFSRVLPGQYNVRLLPGNTPPVRVDVNSKEVDGVTVTAGVFALGRASVDDGSALPFLELALTAGIPDPLSTITVGGVGRSEGRFIFALDASTSRGGYEIVPRSLPLGYYVKSMTSGDVDLLQSPLVVTGALSTEIEVVLTKTPPPGTPAGVSVSGHVTRLENVFPGAKVYLSLQSLPTITDSTAIVAETTANGDGTFEFRNVPPGRYCSAGFHTTVIEYDSRDHQPRHQQSRTPSTGAPTSDSGSASTANSAGWPHFLHANRHWATV